MTIDLPLHDDSGTPDAVADHVSEARLRARQVLGSEAHLAAVDDWRRAIISARDPLILIWLIWLALEGFGAPPWSGLLLVALAVGLALLIGVSTGRSTFLQVQYYEAELERERTEIRDTFEHECAEVRALYAAKGFREPLLEQVVEVLTSDEDRLLKLMMEEELGLSMQHINHPLLVGLWNFSAAAVAGVALALPLVWLDDSAARAWMPVGGSVLLAVLSIVAARVTRQNVIEIFTAGVIIAAITGGTVYLLAKWLAGYVPIN